MTCGIGSHARRNDPMVAKVLAREWREVAVLAERIADSEIPLARLWGELTTGQTRVVDSFIDEERCYCCSASHPLARVTGSANAVAQSSSGYFAVNRSRPRLSTSACHNRPSAKRQKRRCSSLDWNARPIGQTHYWQCWLAPQWTVS